MKSLHKLRTTLSYVTRIAIEDKKKDAGFDIADLEGLAIYLPAAGLFVGAFLALATIALSALNATPLMTGLLLTVTWLLVTGGLHFDGLMDAADGILSHRNPERMIEIMSDSRVGNFGAITGFCVLLFKIISMASLPLQYLLPAVFLIPVWARWCATWTIAAFPYLKPIGMGKIWHDTTKFPGDVLIAAALPLLTLALSSCYFNPLILLGISGFTIASGLFIAYRINTILGGHTGDTYGCTVELAEAGGLLCLALLCKP